MKSLHLFCCMCLISMSLGAQMQTETLDSVFVKTKISNPKTVIKLLSKDYMEHFSSHALISKFSEYRAIAANGHFIDLKAGVGFSYHANVNFKNYNPDCVRVAYINRYASESFTSSRQDVLPAEFINAPFPLGYNNQMGAYSKYILSSVVYFSPLNNNYLIFFDYSFNEEYPNRLQFTTSEDMVEKRLPFRSKGYIEYNRELYRVEKVVFEQLENYDRYTKKQRASHTSYTEVFYAGTQSLYIVQLYSEREWLDMENRIAYVAPCRRNPNRNQIKEYYLWNFDPPHYMVDPMGRITDILHKKRRADLDTLFSGIPFNLLKFETVPYTAELWTERTNRLFDKFPFEKANNELSDIKGMVLQLEPLKDYSVSERDYHAITLSNKNFVSKYFPKFETYRDYHTYFLNRFTNEYISN